MENQFTPYIFGQSTIRTTTNGDAVWFVATDVALALGYRNAPDASRHLDDDEKGTQIVRTLGGDQNLTIINESGLYALVLRSRKPEARKFAKWVTGEVLPAIRQTGSFSSAAPAPTPAPAQQLPLSLRLRRFLMWYDHNGVEQIKDIPFDQAIASPNQWAGMIRESGGIYLSTQALADIAHACTERLASTANYYQSTNQHATKKVKA